MANYQVIQFTRLDKSGVTSEWRTDEVTSSTLAYVDYHGAGLTDITVIDPYTGYARVYAARGASNGHAIVMRHLAKLGYKKCVSFRRLTDTDLDR